MQILLLGGTGFLGKYLLRLLNDGEDKIFCLYRTKKEFFSNFENIHFINLHEFINTTGIKKIDYFINLCCSYKNSSIESIFLSNLFLPLHIVFKLDSDYLKKIITIGSGLPITYNTYTYSKYCLKSILLNYVSCTNKRIQLLNLNPEYFYGLDEPQNRFLSTVLTKLCSNEQLNLSEGKQIRDFIYVEDLASIIYKIIKIKSRIEYVDIPIGTGYGISIRNLVCSLKDCLGSNSVLNFGALETTNEPNSVANTTILNDLNIMPKYSIKSGLDLLINNHLNNQENRVSIDLDNKLVNFRDL